MARRRESPGSRITARSRPSGPGGPWSCMGVCFPGHSGGTASDFHRLPQLTALWTPTGPAPPVEVKRGGSRRSWGVAHRRLRGCSSAELWWGPAARRPGRTRCFDAPAVAAGREPGAGTGSQHAGAGVNGPTFRHDAPSTSPPTGSTRANWCATSTRPAVHDVAGAHPARVGHRGDRPGPRGGTGSAIVGQDL